VLKRKLEHFFLPPQQFFHAKIFLMTESLNFSNPREELAYLRSQVVEKEKELERFGQNRERNSIVRDSIKQFEQISTLHEHQHQQANKDAERLVENHREVELEEMMRLTEEKGVLHTLKVV
jgi:hypothetical protein